MAYRTDLVYSKSGHGKSRWIIEMAKRVYKETGLITRVYLGDGGGETYYNSGLIEAGVLELFQFNVLPNPFETCRACAEGYWPDEKGQLVATPDAVKAQIGQWAFEGLSVMGDYMMGDTEGGLAARAAKGEKIGQDSPINITDGKAKVGGNPPTHYNVVQRALEGIIERSRALPGMVTWTAHERLVEGDKEFGNIIGPDCVGKAMMGKIGGKFGNTIHLDIAHKKEKKADPVTGKQIDVQVNEHRAYTSEHYDPDGITLVKYFANNRCPEVDGKNPMPHYLTPVDPVKFYQILATAKEAVLKGLKKPEQAA